MHQLPHQYLAVWSWCVCVEERKHGLCAALFAKGGFAGLGIRQLTPQRPGHSDFVKCHSLLHTVVFFANTYHHIFVPRAPQLQSFFMTSLGTLILIQDQPGLQLGIFRILNERHVQGKMEHKANQVHEQLQLLMSPGLAWPHPVRCNAHFSALSRHHAAFPQSSFARQPVAAPCYQTVGLYPKTTRKDKMSSLWFLQTTFLYNTFICKYII